MLNNNGSFPLNCTLIYRGHYPLQRASTTSGRLSMSFILFQICYRGSVLLVKLRRKKLNLYEKNLGFPLFTYAGVLNSVFCLIHRHFQRR